MSFEGLSRKLHGAIPRKIMVLTSIVMLIGGLFLIAWSLTHLPINSARSQLRDLPPSANSAASGPPISTHFSTPISIQLHPHIPIPLTEFMHTLTTEDRYLSLQPADAFRPATFVFDLKPKYGYPIYEEFFAAATRFDTIHLSISLDVIETLWQTSTGNPETTYQTIAILQETEPALEQLLGTAGSQIERYPSTAALVDAVRQNRSTLTLVPFHSLTPRLAVLAVDGQNPVENANQFDPFTYPLIAKVYAHAGPDIADKNDQIMTLLKQIPASNRDPERLTVVAMTGVTALVRRTAAQMDRLGAQWPAEIVGPVLSAADITTMSNEVPFVPGCETNDDPENLTFCTNPAYMATLIASGADVIGLTGNHQNDYGHGATSESLALYEQAGLSIYGGGANLEAARAPLYLEHNGNQLAFIGANSYGPTTAWATDDAPGSAQFDLAIMSNEIRAIKQNQWADVVFAELQYQETYGVEPLNEQRYNFRALVDAGADIMTGIQSHVPQAIEFVDENIILYGLGNLYFDQMWSLETREALIAKHTIYAGQHISTQLLPTILHDYGQPHWADDSIKERILQRVFDASRD